MVLHVNNFFGNEAGMRFVPAEGAKGNQKIKDLAMWPPGRINGMQAVIHKGDTGMR